MSSLCDHTMVCVPFERKILFWCEGTILFVWKSLNDDMKILNDVIVCSVTNVLR